MTVIIKMVGLKKTFNHSTAEFITLVYRKFRMKPSPSGGFPLSSTPWSAAVHLMSTKFLSSSTEALQHCFLPSRAILRDKTQASTLACILKVVMVVVIYDDGRGGGGGDCNDDDDDGGNGNRGGYRVAQPE